MTWSGLLDHPPNAIQHGLETNCEDAVQLVRAEMRHCYGHDRMAREEIRLVEMEIAARSGGKGGTVGEARTREKIAENAEGRRHSVRSKAGAGEDREDVVEHWQGFGPVETPAREQGKAVWMGLGDTVVDLCRPVEIAAPVTRRFGPINCSDQSTGYRIEQRVTAGKVMIDRHGFGTQRFADHTGRDIRLAMFLYQFGRGLHDQRRI